MRIYDQERFFSTRFSPSPPAAPGHACPASPRTPRGRAPTTAAASSNSCPDRQRNTAKHSSTINSHAGHSSGHRTFFLIVKQNTIAERKSDTSCVFIHQVQRIYTHIKGARVRMQCTRVHPKLNTPWSGSENPHRCMNPSFHSCLPRESKPKGR